MQSFKRFSGALFFTFLIWNMQAVVLNAQETGFEPDDLTKITVPGSQVTVMMPNVYVYDETQSAYVYSGASSSIFIRVMPQTSFTTLGASITEPLLEKQQMKVREVRHIALDNGKKAKMFVTHMNIQATDGEQEVEYKRLVFLTGDETFSVWVTVNYPEVTAKLLDEPIEKVLRSVDF